MGTIGPSSRYTLETAYEEVKKRSGKYSKNKEFIDALYRDGILTKEEYREINGEGLWNVQENMDYVRKLIETKIADERALNSDEVREDRGKVIKLIIAELGDNKEVFDLVQNDLESVEVGSAFLMDIWHSCNYIKVKLDAGRGNLIIDNEVIKEKSKIYSSLNLVEDSGADLLVNCYDSSDTIISFEGAHIRMNAKTIAEGF